MLIDFPVIIRHAGVFYGIPFLCVYKYVPKSMCNMLVKHRENSVEKTLIFK